MTRKLSTGRGAAPPDHLSATVRKVRAGNTGAMINIVGLDRLRRQIDHRNWEQPKLIRIADAAVEYRHSRDVSNGGPEQWGGRIRLALRNPNRGRGRIAGIGRSARSG